MAETDELSRAIAQILKEARERSDFSIRALADALEVSPTTLQAYLNGTTAMRVPDAYRIAQLLGRDFKRVVEEAEATLGRHGM